MRAKIALLLPATLLIAGTLWTLHARRTREPACPECNVILISIDTLRADHLGCYGYERDTSPRVDAFSRDAVLFSNAIAQAPSTTASHASIFTSLIVAHHGASRARQQPIPDRFETMAETLKAAGYRTASFNGGGQVARHYGFDRGFEIYESKAGRFSEKVGSAVDWLRRVPDEKFFLFLHTYEVHAPYDPPAEYLRMFDADYAGKLEGAIRPGTLIEINDGHLPIDDEDARHIVSSYDAEIRSMDDAFGSLVDFLRERKLLDRTIVVFTSDHGEEFGEHAQMGRHGNSLYDEVLNVPLIVRAPGRKSSNRVVESQVQSIDILPTITDLLGLEQLPQYDGASLVPLLRGRKNAERPAISQIDIAHERPPVSIRTGSEKLIRGSRSFVEGPGYRWFERRVEFEGPTHNVDLRIESFHRPRRLRISIDGQPRKEVLIQPHKQPLNVPATSAGSRIAIESLTPCTRPDSVGLDLGLPCVSFRIFNPFEFFRIDDDPEERHNLFDAARHRRAVMRLERRLDSILASRPRPSVAPVEIDTRTRERLEALGYVD